MKVWSREAVARDMPVASLFSQSHFKVALIYLAAFTVLDWVSYVHPVAALGITPWNPPTGLSFALVLLLGREFIPWLFVAPFVANALVIGLPLPLWVHVTGACIVGLGYSAATAILSMPALAFDRTLSSKRSLMLLIAVAVVSAIAVAVSYVGLLVLSGAIDAAETIPAIMRMWIGDMIGVTVLTPFLLILFTRRRFLVPSWEFAALVVFLIAALAAVFGLAEAFGLHLFYLFFLPVVWTAVRFGLEGVTAGLVLTQLGLMVAIHIAGVSANDVTAYQALMVVLALTGLAIGAVVSEEQRAQHQLRLNQEALERAARLDTMGAFAATLAHEINQPLTAISNYTRLAKQAVESEPPDTATAATAAQHAITQVDRAAEVVRRLRDFIKLGRNETAVLGVSDLIRDAAAHCRPELAARGIELEVRLARALPPVVADSLQVRQVLVNLVRNAAESISLAHGTVGRIVIDASLSDNGRVVIKVRDNGPGFDPDVLDKALLTPFTSTKETGLGLGLALARSTAESHGGQLTIESTSSGATVSFTLAAAKSKDALQ
jgi:signal transduction histidine kinase